MTSISARTMTLRVLHGNKMSDARVDSDSAVGKLSVSFSGEDDAVFCATVGYEATLNVSQESCIITGLTITEITQESATVFKGSSEVAEHIEYTFLPDEVLVLEDIIKSEITLAAAAIGIGNGLIPKGDGIKRNGDLALLSADKRVSMSFAEDTDYIKQVDEYGSKGLLTVIIDSEVAMNVAFEVRFEDKVVANEYGGGRLLIAGGRELTSFGFKEFDIINFSKLRNDMSGHSYQVSEVDTNVIKAMVKNMVEIQMFEKEAATLPA